MVGEFEVCDEDAAGVGEAELGEGEVDAWDAFSSDKALGGLVAVPLPPPVTTAILPLIGKSPTVILMVVVQRTLPQYASRVDNNTGIQN